MNITGENKTPYRNVEIVDDGVIVTYKFNGGIYQQDPLYPDAKFWKIPGFSLNNESGKPATLLRWDSFAIPEGSVADIKILESEYSDTIFTLSPARHPLLVSDTVGYTLKSVPKIFGYTGFYPQNIVATGLVQNYRGKNILKVGIYPIQYDNTNGIVRNYTLIKYKVYFSETDGSPIINTKIGSADYMLENLVLNSSIYDQTKKKKKSVDIIEDNKDYLIVSVPKYEDAILKFAEWKKIMGFRVHIVLDDNWTEQSVKDTVLNLYNQDNINLYYLLIVGDVDDVPSHSDNTFGIRYVTDLFYGCMGDEDDCIPEVFRGRIPVNSIEEAEIIFNKIINYEQNPISDVSFYNTGMHCAYFQDTAVPQDNYADRRFAQTSEEILNYMQYIGKKVNRVYYTLPNVTPLYWNKGVYSFGEPIPDYLKKPVFLWNGNRNDIKKNINKGCFYVLQRDHGGVTCWGHPSFGINDIKFLENGNKLPIIFSISCLTGKFNHSSDCFAEAFLKKNNGGCVGIFAATEESYSGYNDVLSETMFDAIWPDSILRIKMKYKEDTRIINSYAIYELGGILDMGMNYLDEVYGDVFHSKTSTCLYTRKLFHCFGDPSMRIRTENPNKFSPVIKRDKGIITVNTNENNTKITFYIPETNHIDSYIGRAIEYIADTANVIICLDKQNYIPYIVNSCENINIQNETIEDKRVYVGDTIRIGRNVTTSKSPGDVIIQGADITLDGRKVVFHKGTSINSSNVKVNIK